MLEYCPLVLKKGYEPYGGGFIEVSGRLPEGHDVIYWMNPEHEPTPTRRRLEESSMLRYETTCDIKSILHRTARAGRVVILGENGRTDGHNGERQAQTGGCASVMEAHDSEAVSALNDQDLVD
jgi:hypothetical protein